MPPAGAYPAHSLPEEIEMNSVAQEMQKATFDRARELCIETKFDKMGGFYAANLSNHTIAYAYPSSTHAVAAKKNPAKTADAMLFSQSHILPATEQPQWFKDRWPRTRAAMLAA